MAKANETSPATASASQSYAPARPADANGTHRFAEADLSPAAVIRCFGDGEAGYGCKVSRLWVFCKGGLVFTLYDWKATALYSSELGRPEDLWTSEELFPLHVGSKHPATTQDVSEFLDYLRRTIDAVPATRVVFEKARRQEQTPTSLSTSPF